MYLHILATYLFLAWCCRFSMGVWSSGRSLSRTDPWPTAWRATTYFNWHFTSLHMSCSVHNKMHIFTYMWVLGTNIFRSLNRQYVACFLTLTCQLVACYLRSEPSCLWWQLGGDPKQENHQSRERSGSQQTGQQLQGKMSECKCFPL